MPLIIDRKLVAEDSWQRVADAAALPARGDLIIDWPLWTELADRLAGHDGRLGVCIDGDVDLDELAPHLSRLSLVAVHFPSFADGRGFSMARLLREKYGFGGQIRAVGEVSQDRLRYMARCGFDAFEIADERFDESALAAFEEISVAYQGAADDPRPLFRRLAR